MGMRPSDDCIVSYKILSCDSSPNSVGRVSVTTPKYKDSNSVKCPISVGILVWLLPVIEVRTFKSK